MPQIRAYITLDDQPVLDFNYLEREVVRLSESEAYHGIDLSRVRNRANSLVFPRGFDPGRGYVLMERKDANELSLNTADHKLKFVAGGTIEFQKLLIVAIEEITGTDKSDVRSCCLVELADLRVLGKLTSIDKSYNVLIPDEFDYFAATTNGGSAWTYQTLIQSIWTFMPSAFGSLTTTDANFPTAAAPQNYVFRGCSAWDALRKVVEDIHHTLVLNRTGNFSIVDCSVSPGDYADARDDNKKNILHGSHDFNLTAAVIPEKVRVFFPRKDKAWQTNSDSYIVTYKDHWQVNPLYHVDVDTSSIDPDLEVVTGTIHPIHDTLNALYDETGSLTNSTSLSNRATEVATGYVKAIDIADSPSNFRYTGARSFSPDADLSCVAYYDFGYGIITETRGTDRNLIPSPILQQANALIRSFSGDPFTNNTGPHLTQPHLDPERFVIAELQSDLTAFSSTTARVQYGTGSPVTWDDAVFPTRTISVFNITAATYSAGTLIVCWFHQQNEKWIAVTSAAGTSIGVPFKNVSGYTVPPGGCMHPLDSTVIGGIPYVLCFRPGEPTGEGPAAFPRMCLINGQTSVANNGTGLGSWLTDLVGFVALDDSAHTPGTRVTWGPKPHSFGLAKDRLGFNPLYAGDFTINGQRCGYFKQHVINDVYGKYYDDLHQGSTALFEIYYRNGAGAIQPAGWDKITVFDFWLQLNETVKAGTKGTAHWYCGNWEAGLTHCEVSNTNESYPSGQRSALMEQNNALALSLSQPPTEDPTAIARSIAMGLPMNLSL